MNRQNKGTILPVRLYGDNCLRRNSDHVIEINESINQLVDDLIETMYAKDGVGLAAPQVGENLRIFVVDPQWFKTSERHPLVFINPKFISMQGVEEGEEGCLSLPEITAEVTRAGKVVVEAINEKGESIQHQAEGLLARAIQHEYDHLDGVLFIDRLSKLKQLVLKPKLRRIKILTGPDGVNTDENLTNET